MKHASNRRSRGRSNGKRYPNQRGGVFESNGPEVKVRGTPQQVQEKYLALARDAQSAGDRVQAEAYFQYAEHYLRIISGEEEGRSNRNGGQPGEHQVSDQDYDGDDDEDEQGMDRGQDANDGGRGESDDSRAARKNDGDKGDGGSGSGGGGGGGGRGRGRGRGRRQAKPQDDASTAADPGSQPQPDVAPRDTGGDDQQDTAAN